MFQCMPIITVNDLGYTHVHTSSSYTSEVLVILQNLSASKNYNNLKIREA